MPHFIECATLWADIIIVGDHNSSDATASIASRNTKVRIVSLNNTGFDRGLRRKMLLTEARKTPGDRLIFSIDADEMISANWAQSPEWALMLNAKPGTKFKFDWLEILPGVAQAAVFSKIVAFKDDGSEYVGDGLTQHELPLPATSGETVPLRDIKLLHYILIDPERMFSKHRWFKCIEHIELGKRPWPMCVMYQDTTIKNYDAPVVNMEKEWLEGYGWLCEYQGFSRKAVQCYWYDEQVLDYFDKYGTARFSKLNIWDADWNAKAKLLGKPGAYDDCRSAFEIWLHAFITKHREELKMRRSFKARLVNRLADVVLGKFGW